MWAHLAIQDSADTLRVRGAHLAGPAQGWMASGLVGEGCMIESDEILGYVRFVLGRDGPLCG